MISLRSKIAVFLPQTRRIIAHYSAFLLFFISIFFVPSLFGSQGSSEKVLKGKVVRVADGDTITVLDSASVQHKVRLDKIDAPEKAQAYGNKSKEHLASFVAGKDVKVKWRKKDRYERILGEVYIGEKNINLQMVKDGFAWHYKYYDSTPAYAEAEKAARAAKLGLWQDPNPITPYEFRKAKSKVRKGD